MGVSKNRGTPKSSILIGFSLIFTIHFGASRFLETPIFYPLFIYHNQPGAGKLVGHSTQHSLNSKKSDPTVGPTVNEPQKNLTIY